MRSEERAKPVKAAYPNVKLVYGDNNAAAVLENAAAAADIVIRTLPTYLPTHLFEPAQTSTAHC